MKVICLVPSWTETLIECGVNVVGRTRFCIHPKVQIQSIPMVGGTKDLDWDKVKALGAELLILDQEENLIWMEEQSPIAVHVTHVKNLESMASEMERFAQIFPVQASAFLGLQQRWELEISKPKAIWNFQAVPAAQQSWGSPQDIQKLIYVIWRNPWMRITPETWIGSMLEHLGAGDYLSENEKKYPSFEMNDQDLEKTYFLFSSEPFPFHKRAEELKALGGKGAIVDGEAYSWFGIRALRFLESLRT